MGDIYDDKMRVTFMMTKCVNFQQKQDDIQNSIQASADNYTNELNESKIADIQNKTIGSELMFSSIPATFSKGIETFDRVKGLYKKIQALPEKVSGIVDDAKTQASSLIEDTKAKAGGLLEDAKNQAGGLLDYAKGQAGGLLDSAKGQAGGLLDSAKGQAGAFVEDLGNSPETTINLKRADLINKVNAYHDELNPVFPELGANERQMDLDEVNNASDSKIVSMHQDAGLTVNREPIADPLDLPTTLREVQFDNPLYEGEGEGITKPAITAETFGNVKNYLGGQVGDLGSRVSVLPNMETSVGSLKQAIPKPVAIDDALSGAKAAVSDTISGAGDAVSDISGRATDAVSNLASGAGDAIGDVAGKAGDAVSDIAGKAGDIASGLVSGGTDIAETAVSALAEAAVPIVGDVLAVGSLVAGAYEGIKDLVDKPSAPAPPTINLAPGGVNQAGI
jgi:F0F1-type ATP synthase membrane subunit b/b'